MWYSNSAVIGKLKACFLLGAMCFGGRILAEGSKELTANGGSRAFLVSGNTSTPSYLFPTPGTMKVYVKAGETIYAGSSVQGKGSGTINLRSPNGGTFTSGTSATVGLIANRAQEVAGPQPNSGGYTPYTHTVTAAEEGVWEIDFVAQNGGAPGSENPVPIAASANWTQPTGQYICAFDVSVRNAANTTFLTGRVYTNIFSGILGTFDVGFNGVFQVLTKDGYLYSLDNNGQAGNGFSFFVNNKGFRAGDGSASYLSVNSLDNPNIQDPRADDTASDITYKIFFNTPAADLPATANTPHGSTWLLNPTVNPTLTNPLFKGAEGTLGRAGTAPLGGIISFTTSKNGTYTIQIDVNKNGVFTDAIDRKLTGTVTTGDNFVSWDGLDGLGSKVPAGTGYIASLSVILFGGEVHFPFFDVERNVNGIKLTRTNGPLSPDFTVYWDDSPITVTGTPSNPIKNTTGINSQVNGHKWGSPGSSPSDFGDEKGLDTWTYITNVPLTANISFQLQEADLEVTDINAASGSGCVGEPVSYSFTVKNNGPNAVTGSKLSFTFPADLSNVQITHSPLTGTSNISAETTANGAYTATADLTSGASVAFIVTGKVLKMPASGSVTVKAGILRVADMTDPDATNPDSAPPTSAQDECDSAPSGTGCNNVKTNVLAFIAPPDAGPDQTVFQNETATLTAGGNGSGTWSQLGAFPVSAIITTPNATSTTVTGLSLVGKYNFIRTNANGCTDTVVVNVIPKKIDIPTVITPDGDGKNDTFVIPNVNLFPGSQLIIVNRWGNEVFRSDNYQNTWNGNGLSAGTYYYVFNLKSPGGGFTTYKGWVFLKR